MKYILLIAVFFGSLNLFAEQTESQLASNFFQMLKEAGNGKPTLDIQMHPLVTFDRAKERLGYDSKRMLAMRQMVQEHPELLKCRFSDGLTPLQIVAKQGNLKLVNFFLQQSRINVNGKNDSGETALHIALQTSAALRSAAHLKQGNFNVTAWHRPGFLQTMQDDTKNRSKIIHELINAGACNEKNKAGKSPIDLVTDIRSNLLTVAPGVCERVGTPVYNTWEASLRATAEFLRDMKWN